MNNKDLDFLPGTERNSASLIRFMFSHLEVGLCRGFVQTLQTLREDPFGFGFIQGLLQLLRPLLQSLFQLGYLLCQAVDVMSVRVFPLLQHGHVPLLGSGHTGPRRRLPTALRRRSAGQEVDQGQTAAEAQDNKADMGHKG